MYLSVSEKNENSAKIRMEKRKIFGNLEEKAVEEVRRGGEAAMQERRKEGSGDAKEEVIWQQWRWRKGGNGGG